MNILLVDDHKIIVEGIKALLLKSDKINSVEILTDARRVLPFLNSHSVDLLITDINMPEISGLELIRKIKPLFPKMLIGVLSMYFNKSILLELQTLNVNLCLHKNVDLDELELAIEEILNNKVYIQENIKELAKESTNLPYHNPHDLLNILSNREIEVYQLIMKNYKSYEIADKLFVSINTIKAHRKSILKKTECKTVQELIILGIKMGLDCE